MYDHFPLARWWQNVEWYLWLVTPVCLVVWKLLETHIKHTYYGIWRRCKPVPRLLIKRNSNCRQDAAYVWFSPTAIFSLKISRYKLVSIYFTKVWSRHSFFISLRCNFVEAGLFLQYPPPTSSLIKVLWLHLNRGMHIPLIKLKNVRQCSSISVTASVRFV